jgi:hypothetical protein
MSVEYDLNEEYENNIRPRIDELVNKAQEIGMPIIVLVGTSVDDEGATVNIAEFLPTNDEDGEYDPERIPSVMAMVNVLYHNMTAYKLAGTFLYELNKQGILMENPENYEMNVPSFFEHEEDEENKDVDPAREVY